MASFELSPIYRHSSSSTQFDPLTSSVVSYHHSRLIIRDSISLQIKRTFTLPDSPSPEAATTLTDKNGVSKSDREKAQSTTGSTLVCLNPLHPLILIFTLGTKAAFIYSTTSTTTESTRVEEDEPVAKILIGSEGAVAMEWSPRGDTILVWSAHHLRLTLHRLPTSPTSASSPLPPPLHILNPKLSPSPSPLSASTTSTPNGHAFRPLDALYLALLERDRSLSRDLIAIYSASTWSLIRHTPSPSQNGDLAGIKWSPCGRYLAVWESPASDYAVWIMTPMGNVLGTLQPYSTSVGATSSSLGAGAKGKVAEGITKEKEREREERSREGWVGLGVRTVEWSPTGDWLAVGGWDGKIRILTRLGWSTAAELNHPTNLKSTSEFSSVKIWREPQDWIEKTKGRGIVAFDEQQLPISPLYYKPSMHQPNPKMGVREMQWSKDGVWLASHSQAFPTTLWIFQIMSSSPSSSSTPTSSSSSHLTSPPHFQPHLHSLILHTSPITSFHFSPSLTPTPSLISTSATQSFALWTPGVVEGVGIPCGPKVGFGPMWARIEEGGGKVLLGDKEMWAVAYVGNEDEEI